MYTSTIKSHCTVASRYTNVYDSLTAEISLGSEPSLFLGFELHIQEPHSWVVLKSRLPLRVAYQHIHNSF